MSGINLLGARQGRTPRALSLSPPGGPTPRQRSGISSTRGEELGVPRTVAAPARGEVSDVPESEVDRGRALDLSSPQQADICRSQMPC